MPSYLLAAIGKWKAGPERSLYEGYAGRLQGSITLAELAGAPNLSGQQRRERETGQLLERAQQWQAQQVIYLDSHAPDYTSETLASYIEQWEEDGKRRLAFLIGGDVGLASALLPAQAVGLSMGRLTWPHLLIRPMLAEQLYRAQTIRQGHPYHLGKP